MAVLEERFPINCPQCGSDRVLSVPLRGEQVTICGDCGITFKVHPAQPPKQAFDPASELTVEGYVTGLLKDRIDEMDPVTLFNYELTDPRRGYSWLRRDQLDWYETQAVNVAYDLWKYDKTVPDLVGDQPTPPQAHIDRIGLTHRGAAMDEADLGPCICKGCGKEADCYEGYCHDCLSGYIQALVPESVNEAEERRCEECGRVIEPDVQGNKCSWCGGEEPGVEVFTNVSKKVAEDVWDAIDSKIKTLPKSSKDSDSSSEIEEWTNDPYGPQYKTDWCCGYCGHHAEEHDEDGCNAVRKGKKCDCPELETPNESVKEDVANPNAVCDCSHKYSLHDHRVKYNCPCRIGGCYCRDFHNIIPDDVDIRPTNVVRGGTEFNEAEGDPCDCGSGKPKFAEYDGQGIFLTYACDRCRKEKLSHYRPEILRPYTQADVDEPIEPDEAIVSRIERDMMTESEFAGLSRLDFPENRLCTCGHEFQFHATDRPRSAFNLKEGDWCFSCDCKDFVPAPTNESDTPPIKVVCAWCGKTMKEGPTDKGTSHSICPDCMKKELEKWKKFEAGDAGNDDAIDLGPVGGDDDGIQNNALRKLQGGDIDPDLNGAGQDMGAGGGKAEAISDQNMEAVEKAFDAAKLHSDSCRKCFSPIVKDSEGNPGYDSDACLQGQALLRAWRAAEQRALGLNVRESSSSSSTVRPDIRPGEIQARSGAESTDPKYNMCPAYYDEFCRVDGRICPYSNKDFRQCGKFPLAKSFTVDQMAVQDGLDADEKGKTGFGA